MSPRSTKYRSVRDFDTEEELVNAMQLVQLAVSDSFGSHTTESSSDSSYEGKQLDWVLPLFDPATTLAPSVTDEAQRLLALKSFSILDSEREDVFDQITRDVRERHNVPAACLSFVDLGRQWFKAYDGPDIQISECLRKDAFCAHTVLQKRDEVFVVNDTLKDERFRDNPTFVTSEKVGLRFYAGAALISPEGHKLGALCILDKEPHHDGLNQEEQDDLKAKADAVVRLIVERRDRMEKKMGGPHKRNRPRVCSESEDSTSSPNSTNAKKARSKEPNEEDEVTTSSTLRIAPGLRPDSLLPDPKTSEANPDQYLSQLTEAMWAVKIQIKPALELEDFFPKTTEKQMAAYNMEIVSVTREQKLDKLQEFFETRGRDSLDCFNRFGEGLLNMACRRGFKEIAAFLLSEPVHLSVRVRDDYGRTPLHDACWNPEPQLEICSWILEKDPSLFLIADKRGYSPFQYARPSHWHIWRQFLFDNRAHLEALVQPEILSKFS